MLILKRSTEFLHILFYHHTTKVNMCNCMVIIDQFVSSPCSKCLVSLACVFFMEANASALKGPSTVSQVTSSLNHLETS